MSVPKKKLLDTAWNTTTFLLTKQPEDFVDGHRVKIVIVGSGYTGVAIGIAILFKVCSLNSNLILNFIFQKKKQRRTVEIRKRGRGKEPPFVPTALNLRVFPFDDKRTKSGRTRLRRNEG